MTFAFSTFVLIAALIWAVGSDLLYRRVSNRLLLGLMVFWLVGIAWHSGQEGVLSWPHGMGAGILTAALVLTGGLGLFVMRWVGAGDVKLLAVLSLWFGDQALSFLLITSMTGGLLALAHPLLRTLELLFARLVQRVSRKMALYWPRLLLSEPVILGASAPQDIPYGLAIAVGVAGVLCKG